MNENQDKILLKMIAPKIILAKVYYRWIHEITQKHI